MNPSTIDMAEVSTAIVERAHQFGLRSAKARGQLVVEILALTSPLLAIELYWSLRIALVTNVSEIVKFNELFASIFGTLTSEMTFNSDHLGAEQLPSESTAQSQPHLKTQGETIPLRPQRFAVSASESVSPQGPETKEVDYVGASHNDSLERTPFSNLDTDVLVGLRPVIAEIISAMPKRLTHRDRRRHRGKTIDLRDTFRQLHQSGGDPTTLIRHQRRHKPRKIIMLIDISGSMQRYVPGYLNTASVLREIHKAEVFTCATHLTKITKLLDNQNPSALARVLSDEISDYRAGTRLGSSLGTFIDHYGRRGLARGAIILIASDGWESGDASGLRREMFRLSILAKHIIWLSPRADGEEFSAQVQGLRVSLPYCTQFASGNTMASLRSLSNELRRDFAC